MPLSRRHALQALGLAAAGSTAIGKGWSKEARQLRQELEVCSPSGDTFTWMLERNKVFSKAWQRSIQASNPQERIQIKQAIFDASCHIDPQALAQGQRPWAALLSCADARVAPEWMFGVGSGELFQVRVAGNSAFNDGIASLEFAVAALEVPLIVVMGHSGCGAVAAAMGSEPLTPLLEDLVQPIRASLQPNDDLTQAIQGNARYAAGQLVKRSQVLADAQASGKVKIQPAFFDIQSGRVSAV
ncbi:MAG: carbonic anhydrase [Cyanobacteria bacterium]|nr:carbonic anhydrase [Cyanobacteriota bacterium]